MSKGSLTLSAALAFCLLVAGPVFATGINVTVDGLNPDGTTMHSYSYDFDYATSTDPESPKISSWYALDGDGNPIITGLPSWGAEAEAITLKNVSGFLKEEPFVTSVVGLVNPTGFTQTYTITVSLPIAPFAYTGTIASSVGVTVTNSVGASVLASSVAPDGIYSGTVNGVTVLTLLPDLSTVGCGTAGCSTTVSDNSGLPFQAAGPGTATSIGITLKFTLSAFDQIGITSRFEIVPEPTTAALLGVGLVALAIARRRAA